MNSDDPQGLATRSEVEHLRHRVDVLRHDLGVARAKLTRLSNLARSFIDSLATCDHHDCDGLVEYTNEAGEFLCAKHGPSTHHAMRILVGKGDRLCDIGMRRLALLDELDEDR
jgi:acyl-CoA hydrolase